VSDLHSVKLYQCCLLTDGRYNSANVYYVGQLTSVYDVYVYLLQCFKTVGWTTGNIIIIL